MTISIISKKNNNENIFSLSRLISLALKSINLEFDFKIYTNMHIIKKFCKKIIVKYNLFNIIICEIDFIIF